MRQESNARQLFAMVKKVGARTPDTNGPAVSSEERETRRIRIRIDPSDLLLEIISIVVAILLALTVNALASEWKTQQNVHSALASIAAELTDNEHLLTTRLPRHERACKILTQLSERGRSRRVTYTDFDNALTASLPFTPALPESTAWQVADSSGVTANFDFTTRAQLTRVYTGQASLEKLNGDLTGDFRPTAYSRDVDFFLVARNSAADCGSIVAQETRLLRAYKREISVLH